MAITKSKEGMEEGRKKEKGKRKEGRREEEGGGRKEGGRKEKRKEEGKKTSVGKDVEKQKPLCIAGGQMRNVQLLWKMVWKNKNRTAVWFINCISGYVTQKVRVWTQRDACTSVFTVALFTTTKMWEQPRHPSTEEGVKKMWCIYTREYDPGLKRVRVEFRLER